MAVVEGTNAGFVLTAPTADPVDSNTPTADFRVNGGKFTSPSDAVRITEIGWWCDTASQAADFEVGLYAHDSGNNKPNALLASAGPAAKGTTAGWKSISIDFDISSSTIYWIAIQLDNTATGTKFNRGGLGTGTYHFKIGLSSLPSPWGTTSADQDFIPAFYAVYSTTAAGTNMQINIGDAWKEISAMQINIGDAWKAVVGAQINIGDAWKTYANCKLLSSLTLLCTTS